MNKISSKYEIDNIEENKTNIIDLPEGVPPLTSLYLYITNGCNLACRHCWITPRFVNGKPSPGECLDLNLLRKAVKKGKTLGLKTAKITGGEPLLHPKFINIVDYLSKEGIKQTMETNGTLISANLSRHLKQNTTMWFIATSLDSPNANNHDQFRGMQGAFENTIKGIKHLVNVGYRPQIIMSPHRENIHEVEDLVKLAISIGAGSVKFNPVTPTGRGKIMHKRKETLDYDEIIKLVRYIRNDLQNKYPIPLKIMLPPALSTLKEILNTRNIGNECRVLNILGILGNGDMALCGIGRNIPALCFGNLITDDLIDIWVSHPTLVKLRIDLSGKFPGICADCIHSGRCLTHCVAINYELTGKLVNPFYLCSEAERKGEFPVTRKKSY
ncbi:MAG: radical SAM protein [Candidatus Aminicenantes bacterium]|nr:radical SAM protein [Candidatus Aminicenantes bacterium]